MKARHNADTLNRIIQQYDDALTVLRQVVADVETQDIEELAIDGQKKVETSFDALLEFADYAKVALMRHARKSAISRGDFHLGLLNDDPGHREKMRQRREGTGVRRKKTAKKKATRKKASE